MYQYARSQYEFVLSSRKSLLGFCSTLKTEDLLRENGNFGKGSIRNLLVHCVNTYDFWIGECALGIVSIQIEPVTINSMDEIVLLYQKVDAMMHQFFNAVQHREQLDFTFFLGGEETTEPGLKLFSHVITHEYHHKGQILSMSRHLGYTPVDTDIMR
jgi:uncharacterized damage-inducible protein DinB